MKKLNKKGVTLIELIVSFAIVSVAMIYFYQTIVDLHRMYKNSNKATDEFVNKDYALRVLDAWATKSGNNLDNIKSTASVQTKICEKYSMFCADTKTDVDSTNIDFKKVTLKDEDEKIEVIYYKYNKSLITEQLEYLGALVDGNITDVSKFDSIKDKTDVLEVTVDSDTKKINYIIKDSVGNEKYSITNKDTINEIIKNNVKDKQETNINTEVQKLMGQNYNIIESIEIVKEDSDESKKEYARVYNVVDSSGNVIAKNIYQIEIVVNLENMNTEELNKEHIINGVNVKSIKFNKEGLYKLKYLVSAEDKKCMIRLDSTTSIHFNKDKIIQLDGLTISDVSREIEDKNVYITLNKIKLEQTSELNYMSFGGKCTIKLVEAYKYK